MIPLEWFCCMLALFVGCWAGYGVLLEPSSMGTYLFTILVQCVKPRRDWADDQLGTRGQDEYPPLPSWSMGRLVPNTRAGGYARVHCSNCFYPSTSLHLHLSWRVESPGVSTARTKSDWKGLTTSSPSHTHSSHYPTQT